MILIVEPSVKPANKRNQDQPINIWVQRTEIGLDAFADNTNLIGWATSLRDGAPLANIESRRGCL